MPGARRVLIVDDDPDIARGACLWLHGAGYAAETSADGDDALLRVAHHHPDAIVMDVRMPKRSGISVLRELRRAADTRDIPVVMLSASLLDQQEALDYGARFFLRKPYEGRELVAALEAVLAGSPAGAPGPG